MINNIFYVEEGSVDIDELKNLLDEDSHIITYRQGTTPPTLLQPEKPVRIKDDKKDVLKTITNLQIEAKTFLSSHPYDSDAYTFYLKVLDLLKNIRALFGE